MAVNPKSIKNLKPQKKGEKGHNQKGRPKKLLNAIKNLPDDMEEQVYAIIGYAMTLKDENEAKEYLKAKAGELGKYGYLLQITIRKLNGPYGFDAAMDIMDRLYGKPRQKVEAEFKGGISLNINTDEQTKELIEGL